MAYPMTTDNFCFYFQNRLIQTSQTGGQLYSDTPPFNIPWFGKLTLGNSEFAKSEICHFHGAYEN